MKCLDCGGEYIELTDDITLENISIGEFTVENMNHHKCNNCGELLFPLETVKIIEAKEKEIKEYRLRQYPIADFIGATEAAEILNISRQALNQHRRIRRGFIYSVRFGGKIAYLKASVELYRDTGDGRFLLTHPYLAEQPEYTKETETQQKTIESTTIVLGEQLEWKEDTVSFDHDFFPKIQPVNLTIH